MTKAQKRIMEAYMKSDLQTLYDCYERPSQAKHEAYMKCKQRCQEQHGINMTIVSYNTMMFTIAWQFKKDGEWYLHYETSKRIIEFKI